MKKGPAAQAHAGSLLASMNLQRKQVQFCDCVIRKGQGQVYPVHKCLLAASSPVLASIISSTGALVELELPCLTDPILGLLLDYIYTGTLPHLHNKHYSFFLAAAQYLEMDELQNALRTEGVVDSYHNTSTTSESSFSSKLTLLQPSIEHYVTTAESPHSGNHMDSPSMLLSSHVEDEAISGMDGVSISNGKAASIGAALSPFEMTEPNFCICKTDSTLHNFQSIGCSCPMQHMSTMYQDREKNRSAKATKGETWQQSKEELCSMEEDSPRLHSSNLTQMQANENIEDEKKPNPSLQTKADELISDIKNHNSHCCSTSVIRHSSRATRIPTAQHPLYAGSHASCTDVVKDTKAPNQQYTSQVSGKVMAEQEYYSGSTNLNNENSKDSPYYFDSEHKSNKHVENRLNHSFENLCLIKDNTQIQSVTKEKSDSRIRSDNLFAKRKLNEEHSEEKGRKSAKNAFHCNPYGSHSDLIFSSDSTTAEADGESKNAWSNGNQALHRSLSVPSEGNTCQAAYSGQLYAHCEAHADTDRPSHKQSCPTLHVTPDFSPNYSDRCREDDVAGFGVSNLSDPSATISNGQVVLLDISTKSAEMLVSYKRTFEMEKSCGFGNEKMMMNNNSLDKGVSQSSDSEDGNFRLGASSPSQRGTILAISSTTCTPVSGPDNSMSSSSSNHIPPSRLQTNPSDHLSSPVPHAFQCSMCERSFSQRGSLNRHVRSHLGVRPFICPQCPMTFSRQYRVTEHMRVHQRSALGADFPKPPASCV